MSILAHSQTSQRELLSLDKGWRFFKGDIPFPEIKGHSITYSSAKAGKAWGAAAPEFDDTDWRLLTLPHDWAVENPIDSTANVSQGYRHRGIGWYRRNFKLDPNDRGKHLEIQLDGVATHYTLWFNGTILHRNFCGYTSAYIDITAYAKYGEEMNNIAIRVDANVQEGWWYEGAGMYRHTWLVKRAPVHVITDGVYANPVKKTQTEWEIPAEVSLYNISKEKKDVTVEVTLLNDKNKEITRSSTNLSVNPLLENVANLSLKVSNPELWSLEKPTLYKVKTTIKENGKVLDELSTKCGFRTIVFTPDSGCYINDKYIKIQGVCNHQDMAAVGVAVPNSLWEFRIRKLKELGSNAYRCAHHPPAKEFLDVCDSLGFLVMGENRNFNTSPEYVNQLTWMVRRDRNRPSIMLWSVFNEEPMEGTENGYEMVRRMSVEVKKLDTTRPVMAAQLGGHFEPINVSQAVDLVGFNYKIQNYDRFHQMYPNKPMTSSEEGSGLATRGEYKTDRSKNILADYDTEKPGWGSTQREAWKMIAPRKFVAGGFYWTGFDYRGEPTPFTWPSAGSFFGIMDQCGFPKSVYYMRQAHWIKDRPILQLIPHWNWPADSIGKKIKVMAMSNVDVVKLYLNGKLLEHKAVDPIDMATFYFAYKPGKLEAVGFVKGKEVARSVVETTSEAVTLQLIPDRLNLKNDGCDAIPVTVRVLDKKGRAVPTANHKIEFEINENGSILGVGNGDPNCHEADKASKRSLFNGLAQVTIQSKEGAISPIKLTATSPGMKSATITVALNHVAQNPYVEIVNPELIIDKWRISPFFKNRPDPNQRIADNDMNSWAPTKPGVLQNFNEGSFAVYRASFKPYKAQQKEGGVLVLKKVTGKAEVWIDGKLVYTKSTFDEGDIQVAIPASEKSYEVNLLIEREHERNAGLGGVVFIKSLK